MRARLIAVLATIVVTLSACGINSIPRAEEEAKARWADVETQYQRRADLIPNLVRTVEGFAATYFWNMPVDDNAFLTLRTAGGQAAFLHVSCTEWKNLFSLEIYGRDGKLAIDGLGGSYGTERLTFYRMRPEMGPPETTTWEYPAADGSWAREFEEFLDDIRLEREPAAGLPADLNISAQDSGVPINPFSPLVAACGADCALTEFTATDGITPWMTTTAPVVPGETMTLDLLLFDNGDATVTTSILLDNFRWSTEDATVATAPTVF